MLKKFLHVLSTDKANNRLDQENKQAKVKQLKKKKSMLVGKHMIKIEKKIAEGGYADIYRVIADGVCDDIENDVQVRQGMNPIRQIGAFRHSISVYDVPLDVYALKRMFFQSMAPPRILTAEQLKSIGPHQQVIQQQSKFEINDMLKSAFEAEANILLAIGDHDNIIKLLDYQCNQKTANCYEVFLLLEYCPHGTLFDVIEEKCKMGLFGITNETELLQIIYDISNGLRYLHKRKIAHRDLKIENIMKGNDGKWKICDFGSCTQRQYNDAVSQSDREAITEEIEKVTTPIYRAPEQIDLFKGYKINQKVDVWALGCIMFTLMYHKPPFLEGEKLAQINGNYRIPKFPEYSEFAIRLLKAMLTVDPSKRASAEQIFEAAQNLTEICLPKENEADKDGFNFPEVQHDQNMEDFSQDQQSQNNNVNQNSGQQIDSSAQIQEKTQQIQFNQQYVPQVKQPKKEDTSLVDNLLSQVSEEPTQEDKSSSAQSSMIDLNNSSSQINSSSSQQKSKKEQQCAQKFLQVLDMICNFGINKGDNEHAKPLNEKHIRQSIDGIVKDEFMRNRRLCLCIVESLTQPKYVMSNSISALKYLMYCQRLILFCPQIFEYCVDAQQMLDLQQQNRPILISEQLKIFKQIHNHWLKVLKKESSVEQNGGDRSDLQNQDPFIIRTVVALSGYIFNKILMFQEFGSMIDIGLNLRGIVDGAEFAQGSQNGQSLNQQLNQKKLIQNPLKVMFLKNLMNLWQHIAVLNDKLIRDREHYFELKIQLALSILEEQWLLMVNISHLFTAFLLQYNLSKHSLSEALNASFQEFIGEYQQEFHKNVEQFIDFIMLLKSVQLLKHLQKKIPDIPINLVIIINEIVEQNLIKYSQLEGGQVNLKQMLGVNITIVGMKLPIRFKSFIGFSQKCHEKFDLLLCWRSYRDKLGQKYQADSLRSDMPVLGSVGNPQAASYGQFNQVVQPDQQVRQQQAPLPFTPGGFQSKFQSISTHQFERTHSMVQKVIDMQNQKQGSIANSNQSSEITIKYNDDHSLKKRKTSFADRNFQINDISDKLQLQSDEERRSVFNSIGVQGINSINPQLTPRFDNMKQQSQRQVKMSSQLQKQGTFTLNCSEVEFLNNIDKEGIQKHQSDRHSRIGQTNNQTQDKAAENAKPDKSQIKQDAGGVNSADLILDPSLFDAFTEQKKEQAPATQGKGGHKHNPSDVTFAPFDPDHQVGRTSEAEEFFNWGRKSVSEPPSGAKTAEQVAGDSLNTSQTWQQVLVEEDTRNDEEREKPDQLQKASTLDHSKFDSAHSEYFLILNEKNKEIVKKRMMQKQQEYDDEFKQLENEYQEKQKNLIQQKQEVIQKIQEEQKEEQEKVRDQTMKLRQEQIQEEQELKKIQDQILQNKQLYEQQSKDYQDKELQLEAQKKQFEEEKLKFQQEKESEQQKLVQDKQTLSKIHEKITQDKQRTESERQDYEQKIQELEKMKEQVRLQEQELKKKHAELQMKEEEYKNQMQAQLIQQKQNQINTLEPDVFTPDINNKQKNLAVQFIDFILRNKPSQKINVHDLQNMSKIGEGAAANVFRAKYKFTDVAVKQLKVQSLIKDNKLSKEFQREVEALVHMSHPNLVMFMGATADQGHPVIVTEFCEGGTLFELLHEKKKEIPILTYRQRHRMALDIALGMHFMHSLRNPLMHRDLKSLNILLYKNIKTPMDQAQCKITDFGLARNAASEAEVMTGMAGTFHWMAPEVLENQPYTFKADVYSYAIVLWEILAREPPFADYPPHKIMYNVINYKERPPLDKISRDCPQELVYIMRACWEQDPTKRPSFKDIIQGLQSFEVKN